MSTPRTDAAEYDSQPGNPMVPNGCFVVKSSFARQLETELNAKNAEGSPHGNGEGDVGRLHGRIGILAHKLTGISDNASTEDCLRAMESKLSNPFHTYEEWKEFSAQEKLLDDVAVLCRRLARALGKVHPLYATVMDFLEDNDLTGTPLRESSPASQFAEGSREVSDGGNDSDSTETKPAAESKDVSHGVGPGGAKEEDNPFTQ